MNASFDRDRSGARVPERLLRHVRARHRLRAAVPARDHGQGRQPRRGAGAEARRRSDELPLHGAGRHHAHRHLRRRLFRRHPGRAARRRAAPGAGLRLDRGHARLRLRGGRHHLRLAHHRRAGAETPRAPRRRGHRRLRFRPLDGPRRRRQAHRLVPARLDRGGAPPPASARRGAECRDRGGGEGDDRRGHRRRRLPRGRARAARRGDPLRRPPLALDHGAAPRHGLDRRERPARRGRRRDDRLRPLALPALRGLDRRGDRLRARQGHPRDAAHRRPPTCASWRASRSTSARASRRSG